MIPLKSILVPPEISHHIQVANGQHAHRPPAIDNHILAARWLAYRTRLAELTESPSGQSKFAVSAQKFNVGMVEVRRTAQKLASAIEAVVRIVAKSENAPKELKDAISMRCEIRCEIFEYTDSKSSFMLKQQPNLATLSLQLGPKTTGTSTMAGRQEFQNQLEGILGLWIWSLTANPNVETLDKEGRFTISKAAENPTRRTISTSRSIAQTDLKLWVSDQIPTMLENEVQLDPAEAGDPSIIWNSEENPFKRLSRKATEPFDERNVRFFGWYAAEIPPAQLPDAPKIWTVPTNSSLSLLCAQEIFGSFVKSLLGNMDDIGEATIIENPPHFRLGNPLVSNIVKAFTASQLGSESDALLCTLPGIISQLQLSSLKEALTAAQKSANHHRRQKDWTQAQATLKWAWENCTGGNFSRYHGEPTEELANESMVLLGELYRFALCDPDPNARSFGFTGIEWFKELRSDPSRPLADSAVKIIDRYCAVKKAVESAEQLSKDRIHSALQCEHLQETLIYLTLMGATMTSNQKGDFLCLAASKGWTEVVFNLLELATDPNYRDSTSRTPLSYAAENGSVNVVKDLLERGVFKNPEDDQDMTPLSYASKKGQIPIVELLLRNSPILLDLVNKKGKSPLWYAAFGGHEEIVLKLLKKGAKVKTDNDRQNQILLQPARDGNERIVQILLEKGARVDTETKLQVTPLHQAAKNGHERIVQILLEKGARVNAETQFKETPLHKAAYHGHETIVQDLLERGARVNTETKFRETPLHHAAYYGHDRIVQILLEKGAGIDTETLFQATPLYQAAYSGHHSTVQILLERGADITPRTKNRSALVCAAMNRHERTVQILLDRGADVNVNSRSGTALHHAARDRQESMVQILLENNADVHATDCFGMTPLHRAIECGCERIDQMLLENGAQVNIVNSK